MNAWAITDQFGIEHLQRITRATPDVPPGYVLVRVRAVSLNYRDLLMINGLYSPKLPRPRVPGSDAAGEVIAVGPEVTRVRVGHRVTGTFFQRWFHGPISEVATKSALGGPDVDGVFAQEILFHQDGLIETPDFLTDEQAATLPCAAVTAWNALAGGNVKKGDTVLLQGTGGVSLFALAITKMLGATAFITSSSDDKLAKAKRLGADAVLNYKTTPDWDKWARELTAGRGVDHVVEVGGAGTLERSAKATRVGGHIALIGVLAGGSTMNPMPILMRGQTLRGIFVGSTVMLTELVQAMQFHEIEPVIDRVFPFSQLPDALNYMKIGGHFGKIVVRVQ
jgi:NADPH:quinone reductase-like Zn-dependent oxidoreductase